MAVLKYKTSGNTFQPISLMAPYTAGSNITINGTQIDVKSEKATNWDSAYGEAITFGKSTNGTSSNPVTSVSSVPVDKKLVVINMAGSSTTQNLSFSALPPAGRDINIIIKNTSASGGSNLTILIPHGGNYVNIVDGEANMTMVIEPTKYGEINLISDGVTGYIRYVV